MPGREDYYKSLPDSYFKKKEYMPYELEKYDRDSLKEIKKALKQNKYKDRATCQDHLEYLEQLANKVQLAILAEKGEGEVTWELESDLKEINEIFAKVEAIFEAFKSKKTIYKLSDI